MRSFFVICLQLWLFGLSKGTIQLESVEISNLFSSNDSVCLFVTRGLTEFLNVIEELEEPLSKPIGDLEIRNNDSIIIIAGIPSTQESFRLEFRPLCNTERNEAAIDDMCSFQYNCSTDVAVTLYKNESQTGPSQSFSWDGDDVCYALDCANPDFSSVRVYSPNPEWCACLNENADCTGRTICLGNIDGVSEAQDNFDINLEWPIRGISVFSENCTVGTHISNYKPPVKDACGAL